VNLDQGVEEFFLVQFLIKVYGYLKHIFICTIEEETREENGLKMIQGHEIALEKSGEHLVTLNVGVTLLKCTLFLILLCHCSSNVQIAYILGSGYF